MGTRQGNFITSLLRALLGATLRSFPAAAVIALASAGVAFGQTSRGLLSGDHPSASLFSSTPSCPAGQQEYNGQCYFTCSGGQNFWGGTEGCVAPLNNSAPTTQSNNSPAQGAPQPSTAQPSNGSPQAQAPSFAQTQAASPPQAQSNTSSSAPPSGGTSAANQQDNTPPISDAELEQGFAKPVAPPVPAMPQIDIQPDSAANQQNNTPPISDAELEQGFAKPVAPPVPAMPQIDIQPDSAPAAAPGPGTPVAPAAAAANDTLPSLPSGAQIPDSDFDNDGRLNTDVTVNGQTYQPGYYSQSKGIAKNQAAAAKNNNSGDTDIVDKSNDPCGMAVTIANAGTAGNGQNYACAGTKSLISTTQLTSAIGQVGGSVTTGIMGQNIYANEAINGTTQAQSMKDAANLQQTTGIIQTVAGLTQAGMGYMENEQGSEHTDQAKDFDSVAHVTMPGAFTATDVMGAAGAAPQQVEIAKPQSDTNLNGAMNLTGALDGNKPMVATGETAKQAGAQVKSMKAAGTQAMGQLQSIGQQASSTGLLDMAKGAGVAFDGTMAIMAAQEEMAAADKLASATSAVPTGADPFTPVANTGENTVPITGDGVNPSPTITPVANNGMPDTNGFDVAGGPPGDGVAQPGPAPGAFNDTPPGQNAGAAGGGDMGMSTGTAPAAAGGNGDPTSQYADHSLGGSLTYQGGGAPSGSTGGSAGNPALSLKDAFNQLLGHQDAANPHGDIESYRKIASDSAYTPLGEGEDFFRAVHTEYESLQKKGRVGL